MTRLSLALVAVSALALGGQAIGQETTQSTGTADQAMTGTMTGFMGVMDTMMQKMPKESSGNADADFLLMMIPHHQSAIDMAKIELEQGKDEETRAMAQKIIDAQEKEIAEMHAMLERLGVTAPAASN